jgi:hypothetical protein
MKQFVNENEIPMEQALTRNRLGTLMTNRGLCAEKTRRTIENNQVTLYRLKISNIIRIAENYQVDMPVSEGASSFCLDALRN